VHAFTPGLNEIDVAERRTWPLARVLSELADGYLTAGPLISAAGGRLDGIALGEWVHGGDVRAALGEPLAYESDGFGDAGVLLGERSRRRGDPAGRGQPARWDPPARCSPARPASSHPARQQRRPDQAVRRAPGRAR
jgi:hypothetical protein